MPAAVSKAAIALAKQLLDSGMPQREVSRRLKLGRTTVSRIAKGFLRVDDKHPVVLRADGAPRMALTAEWVCPGCGATLNVTACLRCFLDKRKANAKLGS